MRRRAVLLLTVVTVALVTAASPACATTFTVNSTGDREDRDPGDNVCHTGAGIIGVGLECTLRAAIQEANATAGADTINFNIRGTGVRTISIPPNAPLPSIDRRVTINGYTQPGATENTLAQGTNAAPKIELRGSGTDPNTVGSMEGLDIDAPNVVVKGLVINNFSSDGIDISGAHAVIEGNFLGTGPLGDSDQGNRSNGVNITASDVTIGGTTRRARNLISGNNSNGVNSSGTTGVEVLGNLIGTRRDGVSPLGNLFHGVRIGGNGDTVGVNAANTIAFNGGHGVQVFGGGNRIRNNSIFRNGQHGVAVNTGTGNRILGNSILINGDLDIDLGNDGITVNDPKDPDIGANNLQNFPVISSAVTSGGSMAIRGRLNSTPRKTFTIQFFATCCESEPFLVGQKIIKTNKRGNTSFRFVSEQAARVGSRVAATATDGGGNTSEFSNAVTARRP
jgi:CSLREA domain-containing protein